MFTGLIRHLGTLDSRRPRPGGARLGVGVPPELLDRLDPGASIAVNGACLTVTVRGMAGFEADLSEETLRRTTLGSLPIGAILNLEPSLRAGDPLDGHLVAGHVDAVARLLVRPPDEGAWRFSLPPELAPMLASKGSVAVDGISLTVVECGPDGFSAALIPETVRATRLRLLRPGDAVNLEADPVGRYVARQLELRASGEILARFAQAGWLDRG